MKKIQLLAVLLGSIACSQLVAQSTLTITDASLQANQTYNWTKNNVYLLDGLVYLDSGSVLNIEAGTVIKGKPRPSGQPGSSLVVVATAQLNAIGTAAEPIIFTAEVDDLSDPDDLDESDKGLWGGVILLGDAPIANSTTPTNIEGIDPANEPRVLFGGTNPTNNAGTLKYVSIRHGGTAIGSGNEINGLTFGGAGSGTLVDYVEVFANKDDGIEWFGGSANVKHACIAFCGDDSYDWDLGWRGNGQFWFSIQSDTGSTDHGGEWDGGKPDQNPLYANPVVYNLTFIGSGLNGTAVNDHAILMRDGTAGTVANSIFTDFANYALEVEDLPIASTTIDSYNYMQQDILQLKNNIFYGFGSGNQLNAGANGIIQTTAGGDDPNGTALITHLTNNNNQLTDPGIKSISRIPNQQLDPRATAAAVTSGLAAYPSDPFFDAVTYKGAFQADNASWIYGWTALSEYGFLAEAVGIPESQAPEAYQIGQNFPNPSNGLTKFSVTVPYTQTAVIHIYDISGKLVDAMAPHLFTSGVNYVSYDTDRLTGGIYIYEFASNDATIRQMMMVQ